jgi:hypothetical protein
MRRAACASIALFAALTTRTARAQDPSGATPPPCRGDACADVPEESRRPLLVATGFEPSPPTPPPPPGPPPPQGHGRDAAGPRLTFGRAFTRGGVADSYYGRLDTEIFAVFGVIMASAKIGLEGWGGPDGGGGGIPGTVGFGFVVPFGPGDKTPRLLLAIGLGWDWIAYDRVKHTGQFGIFQPLADANIGLDFRGVRLMADASAQYRWGWGDDDRGQYRLGVGLSFDSELWDGPSR